MSWPPKTRNGWSSGCAPRNRSSPRASSARRFSRSAVEEGTRRRYPSRTPVLRHRTLASELLTRCAIPPEDPLAEPDDRVVLAVDDPFLHRDDRVVGDVDPFRAHLGAALRD